MADDQTIDLVTLAILDYEDSTLHALRVLGGHDFDEMQVACQRFVNALLVVRNLPLAELENALVVLLRRGRIPDHAWDVIDAALKFFRISDTLSQAPVDRPTIH
jgi:hypothetical protein